MTARDPESDQRTFVVVIEERKQVPTRGFVTVHEERKQAPPRTFVVVDEERKQGGHGATGRGG